MGIVANVIAIKNISKIKEGKPSKLSIAQITGVITNMMDAKNNLTNEQFKEVFNIYKTMQKSKTKIEMDMNTYLDTSMEIINEFNKSAPYEKYSGLSEMETLLLLKDLQKYKSSKVDS